MDRPTTRADADARGSRLSPHEAFALPSRRPALDLCRRTLKFGTGAGPILLTGDAGIGKTWLWHCLEAEAGPSRRWVGVDLTPANDPVDFYRLIAHEIGLVDAGASGMSRVELVDFLSERQADGERLTLVIEEAHNLSMPVWEEVRVLANRLDRPGGFASLLLVGQTSLARRFNTRPFAAIEARLAARVHLGPIDADEAAELLARLQPDRPWPLDEVEALHRDTAGNPRRMLRKVGPGELAKVSPIPIEPPTQKPQAPLPAVVSAVRQPVPLTGPGKPPISVEENMIEVGWSPDDSPAPAEPQADSTLAASASKAGEEAVHDHYAALQAWREWSENQSRQAQSSPVPPVSRAELLAEVGSGTLADIDYEDEEEEEELPSPRIDRSTIRAEGEQKFAPFGQLFSRMAQAREPD